MTDKPKVIVLCGSSRFTDIMAACSWLLEKREGVITMGLHLMPYWYCTGKDVPSHLAEHEGVQGHMDKLHQRKIDLCDGIFVMDVNHYIGKSTNVEINYAMSLGKPIRWYMDDPIGDETDRILKVALTKLKAEEKETEWSRI